jgi:membrane-bound lytic murein transglycosylase MltF
MNINKLNQDTVWVVTWSDGLIQETRDLEATRFAERVSLERKGKIIVDTWIKDNFSLIILNGNHYFKKTISGKAKARKYVDTVRKNGGKIVSCIELTTTENRVKARELFKQLTNK